jgi:ATP-dependent helicase YprA (DUF1998 family)/very-short-patch-repair endonuclease
VDIFGIRDQVIDEYRSFVQGFLNVRDPQIREHVERELSGDLLWPEPWLALNPAFAPAGTTDELVAEGLLHPTTGLVFRRKSDATDKGPNTPLLFHQHQVEAFRKAAEGRSYPVTTGTGSGKSLTYMVPIVDRVIRDGSGKGLRAIVVYPMNALANSQMKELEKFIDFGFDGHPPVTYRRYTGQESQDQREQIRNNPPDILLTNYMMLELMLLRPDDRRLITSARDLAYLVLDELHTYRGRQGADVALLVRRLRQATGANDVQCVGTSATIAGPGIRAAQQTDVATITSRLFGTPIDPDDVIDETLVRATDGVWDPQTLSARVSSEPPVTYNALRADPLAAWIEDVFGITEREGRLVRRTPIKASAAAAELAEVTGQDPATCLSSIQATLLAGSGEAALGPNGKPLFAFKLHQFISRGDTVYSSLEEGPNRYLSTRRQTFVPGDDTRPLFPLAFCRECGQHYYLVAVDEDGNFVPRNDDDRSDKDRTGYVYLSDTTPWPRVDEDALLERLPEGWVTGHGDNRAINPDRRDSLPRRFHVTPPGFLEEQGQVAAFVTNWRFCLNPDCRVLYESARTGEFTKLATLGNEGRSSATTILSASIVRALRNDPTVDAEARKVLTFTDNRQDASLQAGHFNDFVTVGQIRASVVRALETAGRPVDYDALPVALDAALNLPPEEYARYPKAVAARADARKALKDVVTYRVYTDLARGWRLTMPNLEQVGLLRMDYKYVDEIAADETLWTGNLTLLRAGADLRADIIRNLLDEMRRNLCVQHEYLTKDGYDSLRLRTNPHLTDAWALGDEAGTLANDAWPRAQRRGDRTKADLFLSGTSLYGSWLRKRSGLKLPEELRDKPSRDRLKVVEANEAVYDLMDVLAEQSILRRTSESPNKDGDPDRPDRSYRVNESILLWHSSDGTSRAHDIRVTSTADRRVNPFFLDFYRVLAGSLSGLTAAEHTAQVNATLREDRERDFSSGALPVLYCSPTMELGVDISTLNAVGMRNVPPTPANYAQRSGRAGRAGSPALIITYCTVGSGHDSYYFHRSERMVAGAVAPPRLDLSNKDLVQAHVQAVWLAETGQNLRQAMRDIVDVEQTETLPIQPSVTGSLANVDAKKRAKAAALSIISATPEIAAAPWFKPDWLDDVIDHAPAQFDRAIDRWRDLYWDASAELKHQSDLAGSLTIGGSELANSKRRIAEALAQISLLRGDMSNDQDLAQSDFYTYRYFASEGFLPGYSFPRLPLRAFIPAGRRTKDGEADVVQRPRFLAITEFGPGAFIYYEGSRYAVHRVQLPVGMGINDGPLLETARRCTACGYLHPEEQAGESIDRCQRPGCGQPLAGDDAFLSQLLRMQTVVTRRRDRISADEEERSRAGYRVETALRFEPHGEASSHTVVGVTAHDGSPYATLTYGDTARVRRMNLGYRHAQTHNGFDIDLADGRWLRSSQVPSAGDDDLEARAKAAKPSKVIPFVEDRVNALLIEFAAPLAHGNAAEQAHASVQYALKKGIAVAFQLEDDELAAEPLPSRKDRRLLLMYEKAEGGAGALRRFAFDQESLLHAVRAAIDICHYDPDTRKDVDHAPHVTERCERACYDCLLAYGNQPDHLLLNRHLAASVLFELLDASLQVGAGGQSRGEQYAILDASCTTSLEHAWLRYVRDHGYRLPTHAQQTVDDAYARPDFVYTNRDARVAVFVDGPVHDYPDVAARDAAAEDRLWSRGWSVIRFPADETTWTGLLAENPDLFGAGGLS